MVRKALSIAVGSLLLSYVWFAWGALVALGVVAAIAAVLTVNRYVPGVKRRSTALGVRIRAQLKEPHPLAPVGLSLVGTLLIVNFATIWEFAGDQLRETPASAKALAVQMSWLKRAASEGRPDTPDTAADAFRDAYPRFALDQFHEHGDRGPSLGVEELIEKRYELLGREVTVTGDVVKVSRYPDDVVGLWVWDSDEHAHAEVACRVPARHPRRYAEGHRVRLEGLPLLFGNKKSGNGYDYATAGLACARADILAHEDWSPEEQVNEHVNGLENSEEWESTLDDGRVYWTNHFDDFRLDRSHPYDSTGVRAVPVHRLVWGAHNFASKPVRTWGWIVAATQASRTYGNRRFVLQVITIQEDSESASEVNCEVLRPPEQKLREGQWVNVIGIPLVTGAPASTGGGFYNTVRMVCSGVRVYR